MSKSQRAYVNFDRDTRQLICKDDWVIDNVGLIQQELNTLSIPSGEKIIIDTQLISSLDSAGAWLLIAFIDELHAKNIKTTLQHLAPQHKKLLAMIEAKSEKKIKIPTFIPLNSIERIGKFAITQYGELIAYLNFIGKLTFETLRVMAKPGHFRLGAIVGVIDRAGFQALPIIALLSFMIGVVISYQMGNQLREYGANVFIVNLLGLSILREFGPILTAIMVAGRSGSSITAQLGLMSVNEEIDALNTMGVTPAEILVIPRMIGLLITLPLLTIWADFFGLIGGMFMANILLDVTWQDFMLRFQQVIPLRALIIGLGKAPIFALIIGTIGCFEGVTVKGSAESVGEHTTRSVVLAIFFIIIIDAILSIILSKFNL